MLGNAQTWIHTQIAQHTYKLPPPIHTQIFKNPACRFMGNFSGGSSPTDLPAAGNISPLAFKIECLCYYCLPHSDRVGLWVPYGSLASAAKTGWGLCQETTMLRAFSGIKHPSDMTSPPPPRDISSLLYFSSLIKKNIEGFGLAHRKHKVLASGKFLSCCSPVSLNLKGSYTVTIRQCGSLPKNNWLLWCTARDNWSLKSLPNGTALFLIG